MRILMLSWEYPPRIVGGISRVVHDLAQKIGERGHEIHVVTLWEPNTLEEETDKNVIVHRVKAYEIYSMNFVDWIMHLNFAMVEYAAKLINDRGKFDVIHGHDWMVAYSARVLKHTYNVPMICTIHATEHGRNNGIHNDLQGYINNIEWWLTYEAWKVICNSGYMRDELNRIFQLPTDKIEVIQNGVCGDKFKGIERDYGLRRNYAADNEKIIFFVGRLVQEKGVQVLIDSMPKILHHYNDVKLVIAGKGPQFDQLQWQAYSMGIADRVYFTGYIDDDCLTKLFKCADVAVFPSLYEPFGIVALEAMAASIPVVVTDTGGMGEIVDHAHDGMKAYTGNSNSLADCIIALLHHPELCDKVRANAYEKVNRIYNWDVIADRTIGVYQDVLNKK